MIITPTILQEIGYLLFSYLSSVSIIFINKHIYNDKKVAGTLLMSLHFFSNFVIAASLYFAQQFFKNVGFFSLFKSKILSVRTGIMISLNVALAIFVGNLSLIHNSITVYQLAKLMVIPCILAINFVWLKTYVDSKTFISLMAIVGGMCFVIYGDFYLNLTGSIIALLAIVFGATSQIAINYYCKEYDINGFELLFNHSLYSSVLLAVLAFPVDGVESISHSMNRFVSDPSFFNIIIISCFAAFIVNVAGYLVIGKLSPLTFQVLGHAKTISILIGGFLFFGNENELNPIKLFGILIALGGTIAYSYIKYQQEIKKDQSAATSSVSTNGNIAKHEPLPQSEQEADDLEANLEKQSSIEIDNHQTNEVVTSSTEEELPVQDVKK